MGTLPFRTASEKIKYLVINLIRKFKSFYNENFKSLVKEIERGTRKWKDGPHT